MGLYVQQDDDRTELQKRLAAELQEKSRKKAAAADLPDGVEDSNYLENTKQTTSLAWLWAIIAVAAIAAVIYFIVRSS